MDDPPVAVNDSATVEEDAAATSVSVLTNDTDIDGGPKTISSASEPANGTLVVTGGGTGLPYQPDPNYCNDPLANNLDTFNYTLNGGSQGRVSMTVTCVNDNPVATDESFNGTSRAIGNTSLVVNDPTDSAPDPNGPQKTVSRDILSKDTDVDGPGPLAVQAVSNKATTDGGSVNIEADGDFTFHPKAGTSCTDHTDSFDYTLTDGNTPTAGTDTGTVTIDIQDCVWYVDSSLGTNGDGRSHSPFNSLSGINGVGGTGDPDADNQKIFLYDGSYSGGLRLENGQTLFSQRHGLVVPDGGSGNVTLEAAVPTGPNTTITGGLALGQNNTIQGIHLGNATGAALSGTSVGNATMDTVTSGAIDNQSGKAVDISSGTLSMAFTGVSSSGSSTDGMQLDNVGGTFNASGGSIQNANGEDVDISGNNSGDTVDFTYDGSITDDLGTLVNVSGQNGGTKDFNGAITDGNDDDGSGIVLTNNTGATVRFDGGLTLSTGANQSAFLAAAGGTVVVTDPAGATDNTLASTTGAALNVTNATIGSNGLTFKSISANGASNGISLTNTGNSGGLTVTGNGGTCTSVATCTGGAIQNSTGQGILLTNVGGGVSLTRVSVNNGGDDGIRGSSVNGFTLADSRVTNNGNAVNESGLDFVGGLTGTASISSSTVTGSAENHLIVTNASGSLNLTVTGSSFTNASATVGNDGIHLDANDSAAITASVTGSTFDNNRGDHFQFSTNATSTGTNSVTFSSNTLTGDRGAPFGNDLGAGITISTTGSSDTAFTLANNNIQGAVFPTIGVDLGTASTADATLSGTVNANTIGNAAVAASGGAQSSGIAMVGQGAGTLTAAVTNNTILQNDGFAGIDILSRDGSPTINATVTGNSIANPATGGGNGLLLRNGAITSDGGFTCAAITGNSLAGSAVAGLDDFRLRQRFNTTVRLPGYGSAAGDTAAVVAFVQANNPGTGTGSATVDFPASGGGFVGAAACPTPP